MTKIFMLFAMLCSNGTNCKPANYGYYATQGACQRARTALPSDVTDSQCVARDKCVVIHDTGCKAAWGDPD